MSLEKYKAWMHKNEERKKERELVEHRQMIKVLIRERNQKKQAANSGKVKQGLNAAKGFIGRITPPPRQMQPKPFSKGVNRYGR